MTDGERLAEARDAENRAKLVLGTGRIFIVCQRSVLLALAVGALVGHGLEMSPQGSATPSPTYDYTLAPAVTGGVAFVQVSLLLVVITDKYCDPHLSAVWDCTAVGMYLWLLLDCAIYSTIPPTLLWVLPVVAIVGHLGMIIQDTCGIWRLQKYLKMRKRRKELERLILKVTMEEDWEMNERIGGKVAKKKEEEEKDEGDEARRWQRRSRTLPMPARITQVLAPQQGEEVLTFSPSSSTTTTSSFTDSSSTWTDSSLYAINESPAVTGTESSSGSEQRPTTQMLPPKLQHSKLMPPPTANTY